MSRRPQMKADPPLVFRCWATSGSHKGAKADFRNDIYAPLCYDAEGSKRFLRVIMDAATLRIQGMSPVALKAEIEKRYKNKIYRVPEKAGLSYMIAPVMRTWMMPDWN